jgi:hypothetical protein
MRHRLRYVERSEKANKNDERKNKKREPELSVFCSFVVAPEAKARAPTRRRANTRRERCEVILKERKHKKQEKTKADEKKM